MDYWDSLLNGSDTVGALFRDRGTGAPVSEWTVKVVRLPQDPTEMRKPQRYGSILPQSSARPQKRHIINAPLGVHSSLFGAPYGGQRDIDLYGVNERLSKRQKLHESSQLDQSDPDRPIRSREDYNQGLLVSSQSSRRQGSPVHQVDDSQRSPKNKRNEIALVLNIHRLPASLIGLLRTQPLWYSYLFDYH